MSGRRDPRYSRTVGTPPLAGRRYVSAGKVRIEWTERGARRSRTVGENSAATRKKADQILEEVLATMSEHDDQTHAQENVEAQSADVQIKIPDSVRRAALALTDAADRVADWLEDGLREMWRIPSEPEVEVEAVEEEAEAESPES